ncbi:leucine-rich repeat domain-containing protein [Actinomadura rupiterrae]|uniref:leucine-rich repeat domain-containing protein n=1 Tax=Actinomadura rupiterrae TaxID=559627 RepID=UPI0020A38EDD|nr:leucine-rich repeat domain-containing protein [Actinomadura rupiterrae]MCP2343829.1 hypothetical protein [Actinomadura rupiterrae]
MPGYIRTEEFHGLPVAEFNPEGHRQIVRPGVAWRLSAAISGPPEFGETFESFLKRVDSTQVTALLVAFTGFDGPSAAEHLLDSADRFPNLRALYLGDEQDFPLIWQDDITPVLERFPLLERLDVRGRQGLELQPFRHEALRTFRVESCCLPSGVLDAISNSDMPELEHLDLWLGVDNVAGPADLEQLASGARLPSLRRLGLQNSDRQDEVAEVISSAPVVARLEALCLARGTLTDLGAGHLLSGRPLTRLRQLDLHHHYLSDHMMRRLRDSLPDTEIDLGDGRGEYHGPFEDETYHYVADGRDF